MGGAGQAASGCGKPGSRLVGEHLAGIPARLLGECRDDGGEARGLVAVSYTHLTLPTNREV